MKCPRCGHWNKPTFPRCFQCGEPLHTDESPKAAWREQFEKPKDSKVRVIYDDSAPPEEDVAIATPEEEEQKESLAAEMNRLKSRRARGLVYLEEFRKNAAEQGIAPSGSGVSIRRADGFFSDVPDDPEETVYEPPEIRERLRDASKQTAGKQSPRVRGRAGSRANMPAYDADAFDTDPDLPPSFDDTAPLAPHPAGKTRRRKRGRALRGPVLLARWVVRILGVLAAAVLIWQGALYIQSRAASVPTSDEVVNASVEPIEVDGAPGRRIVITGEEGTQFYIAELRKSYVVVGGVATIEVADYVFYQDIEHLEASQMDVALTPTRIRGGEEKRMAPIQYTIDIPISPITLVSPEADRVNVHTSIYNIMLMVTPKSKVLINGEDKSDQVKDDGTLTHNAAVHAIGDNVVTVTVRAPRCRENNMTLTFYRAPQDVPLELATDTLVKTSSDKMTIYAATMVGATISIESPIFSLDVSKADPNTTGADGSFSFEARMERVGENTITIRASYPGREDSVLEHVVTYLPPADTYTKKAWALSSADYSELLNNINLRIKNAQIYLCKGTIVEIKGTNPQMVVMNTGTAEKEQLVFLENQSYNPERSTTVNAVWELGKTYRVFADVSGLYNGMPKLVARYSYDVPVEQGGTATAAPSPSATAAATLKP